MGLFFDVLSAVNNPNQQASVGQLGSLVSSVQQLSSQTGMDASTTQNVLSAVGQFIQPALQQQGAAMGGQQLSNMVSQIAGAGALGGLMGGGQGGSNPLGGLMGQVAGGGGAAALQGLLPASMQQEMAQVVAQKTGLNPAMIQSMLPSLIPVVMNLLNMGATKPGAPSGGNPLLSAFLDGNHDGNTDLGDVMNFATRFLNPPR
jgi:Bacterial protein of unknown function (DUF937)